MRIVAGLDPGLDGGVAVVNPWDCGIVETASLPTMGDPRVLNCAELARWLHDRDVTEAIVEEVHAMPKQGVSSTFRFGVSFGQLLGVLQTSLIPYILVTPQKWKRSYGLIGKDKDASRRLAIERFPKCADEFARKMDVHRAEAALIAYYQLDDRASRMPQEVTAASPVGRHSPT